MKISGTRFYLLRGVGARLQRALITWMLDVHIEQGYSEVYPPFMVKSECLVGTAQLPKFADTVYRDAEEDFYWVPTAEVPVTNMYRDEVLDAAALPIKHVAYTACFRREKMAHGKDTRGIKRGHQFDKVEMVKFVAPESRCRSSTSWSPTPRRFCSGWSCPIAWSRWSRAICRSPRARSTTSRRGRRAATSGSRCRRARRSATSRRGAR